MNEKIKCTYCGNTDMFSNQASGSCGKDDEGWGRCALEAYNSYICKRCRHIEWFAKERTIQMYEMIEKENAAFNKLLEDYENKKVELEQQIEFLQRIADDENQTVKTVNEAKEKLIKLENELQNLQAPMWGGLGRR